MHAATYGSGECSLTECARHGEHAVHTGGAPAHACHAPCMHATKEAASQTDRQTDTQCNRRAGDDSHSTASLTSAAPNR
jgi:hypothetical protein